MTLGASSSPLLELLTSADMGPMRAIYATALLAGLAIVVLCGVLSVLVVVKRLGFVGQGVSHSAFGGIGVAAVLAALGAIQPAGTAEFAVIVAFCVLAALGMASVSDRRTTPVDSAIGMFLVGSMALGAVLVQVSQPIARAMGNPPMTRSWESILFGSILAAGRADALLAWGVALALLACVWWVRRPMLFWSFDEESAAAFGVPARRMRLALMVVLAVAVVTAMKLAGVILATALLVLPGATAMRLSDRLWPVVGLSVASGVVGLLAGFAASIELDWQAGPSMVLVMTGLFFGAAGWSRLVRRRAA